VGNGSFEICYRIISNKTTPACRQRQDSTIDYIENAMFSIRPMWLL
jgi:hypothetical protein